MLGCKDYHQNTNSLNNTMATINIYLFYRPSTTVVPKRFHIKDPQIHTLLARRPHLKIHARDPHINEKIVLTFLISRTPPYHLAVGSQGPPGTPSFS